MPAFWGNYTMRQKHQGRNAVTNSSLHQMDVLCPTEKTSRRKKQKQKLNKTKQANKHLVIFLRHRVISNIYKQEHSPTFFNGVSFVSLSLTMEDSINTMRHWLINVCSLLHCSSLHIFMMISKNKMDDICIFFKICKHIKSFALDDDLAAFYNDTHPYSNANLHMPVFFFIMVCAFNICQLASHRIVPHHLSYQLTFSLFILWPSGI